MEGGNLSVFIILCTVVLIGSGYIFYLSLQLHPQACPFCTLIRADKTSPPCADCSLLKPPDGYCAVPTPRNIPPLRVVVRASAYDTSFPVPGSIPQIKKNDGTWGYVDTDSLWGRRPDGSWGFLLLKDAGVTRDPTDMEKLANEVSRVILAKHPYYNRNEITYNGDASLYVTFDYSDPNKWFT